MRRTRLLYLLLATLPLIAPATAQKSQAPSIVGNFSDPQDADRATFSPDGRILTVSGFRNDLTLWDLSSGLPIRTLPARAYLTGTVFSNDGQRMLTGHKDGVVRLWDTESGAVLDGFRAKPRDNDTSPTPIIGLSIDRKGEHIITSGYGATATIWNVPARKFLFTIPRTDNESLSSHQSIAASRIAADGKRLIVLSAREYQKLYSATTFDAQTGAQISYFDLPDNVIAVDDGFVSDDEAIVSVSGECESGEFKLFSLKERAVVASVYRPAVCSKTKDGHEFERVAPAREPGVRASIVISQEGHPELTVYDTTTRKVERTLRLPAGSRARVIGVSRDLKLAALAETDRIAIHALDTGALVKSLRSFATPVDQLRISPNGMDVVSQKERPKGSDAPVTVGIRKLDSPRGSAFTVALPADFTLEDIAAEPRVALAKNEKGDILLISLDGKSAPRSVPIAPLTSVARVRLSPDGKIAILDGVVKAGDSGSTKAEAKPGEAKSDKAGEQDSDDPAATFVLNLADGKMTEVAIDKDNEVMSVAFAAAGDRFAFGFRDGSAAIFDARSGRMLKKLPRYPKGEDDGDAGAIAFSPDGTLLAGGATFDDNVFVWDIASGKLMRTMTLPDSLAGYRIVTAVAVSPDRKTFAAGLGHRAISSGDVGREAGGIYLFDLATSKLRHTLRGHTGAITGLTFSKDSKDLVSGGYDGTVRIWDRATGKPMATAAMDGDGRWSIVTEAGFYTVPTTLTVPDRCDGRDGVGPAARMQ